MHRHPTEATAAAAAEGRASTTAGLLLALYSNESSKTGVILFKMQIMNTLFIDSVLIVSGMSAAKYERPHANFLHTCLH